MWWAQRAVNSPSQDHAGSIPVSPTIFDRGGSWLERELASKTSSCGFESCHPCQKWKVALRGWQSVLKTEPGIAS